MQSLDHSYCKLENWLARLNNSDFSGEIIQLTDMHGAGFDYIILVRNGINLKNIAMARKILGLISGLEWGSVGIQKSGTIDPWMMKVWTGQWTSGW
jgi:hypothetical protein